MCVKCLNQSRDCLGCRVKCDMNTAGCVMCPPWKSNGERCFSGSSVESYTIKPDTGSGVFSLRCIQMWLGDRKVLGCCLVVRYFVYRVKWTLDHYYTAMCKFGSWSKKKKKKTVKSWKYFRLYSEHNSNLASYYTLQVLSNFESTLGPPVTQHFPNKNITSYLTKPTKLSTIHSHI